MPSTRIPRSRQSLRAVHAFSTQSSSNALFLAGVIFLLDFFLAAPARVAASKVQGCLRSTLNILQLGGPQGSTDGQARTRNMSVVSTLAQTITGPLHDVPVDAVDKDVIDDIVLGTASVPAKMANNTQVGATKTTPGRAMDDTSTDAAPGSEKNSHLCPSRRGRGGRNG